MESPTTNRRPVERRGEDDEYGKAKERREVERRSGQRRKTTGSYDTERRQGDDRRQDQQRAEKRRSGSDRRSISERLNRVAAILLPPLLGTREDDDVALDPSSSGESIP